ncbi:MAG: hypothetical protein H0X45_12695, partial [Planctomycetes bacterium]|nr:hypothetical protein [Planctomycetota bacterium]
PARDLAFSSYGRGGGGFDLFAGGGSESEQPDPADILELLRTAGEGGDMELRGGNVFLLVTPEEEAAMRAKLGDQFARLSHRSSWRVTFGTAAPDRALATGVVSAQVAREVAAGLTDPRILSLSGLGGQLVHVGDYANRTYVGDVSIVNDRHDPSIEQLTLGRMAEIRATPGQRATMLDFHLSWAEEASPARTSELVSPPGVKSAKLSGAIALEQKDDKKQQGTFSLDQAGGGLDPGQRITAELPEVWTWQPRGTVFLPPDGALVLACGHQDGRAVIVLEAAP